MGFFTFEQVLNADNEKKVKTYLIKHRGTAAVEYVSKLFWSVH